MNLRQLAGPGTGDFFTAIRLGFTRRLPGFRSAVILLSALGSVGYVSYFPAAAQQLPPPRTSSPASWYDSRNHLVSDFGDIAYTVSRGAGITEVWVMQADGSRRRRVKSFLCSGMNHTLGPWRPGKSQVLMQSIPLFWWPPDFKLGKLLPEAQGRAQPMLSSRPYLLDIAGGPGQFFPASPDGKQQWTLYGGAISPEGKNIAFSGWHSLDGGASSEDGIWRYEIESGLLKKIESDRSYDTPAWYPDGRRLILVRGKRGSFDAIASLEIASGSLTRFYLHGSQPAVSPDGADLVFAASSREGYSASGIYLKELGGDTPPRLISSGDKETLSPHWSPEGKRVLYSTFTYGGVDAKGNELYGYELFIAQADGSGEKSVYKAPGFIATVAWAADGKSFYALASDPAVPRNHLLVIAADGSGLKADLWGQPQDSPLTAGQQAQLEGALKEIEAARFQYSAGKVRAFENRGEESKVAFQAAADIFSGLAAKYPLVDFSPEQVAQYAGAAEALAKRPGAELEADACRERLQDLENLLLIYFDNQGSLPRDLRELETWGKQQEGMQLSWVSNRDNEHFPLLFHCPRGESSPDTTAYRYTPPGEVVPELGAPLLACPEHPENKVVIDSDWRRRLTPVVGGE
jgi:hypothetical protein